ncbi:phosphotransferase family protein [Bacillus sp. V5-8f]|uniref:phosphotransferase family protein n=1 Tax=Bacillus sp. V5-8f TaxID=2053044 RepID=UPI000C774EDF|nr:phosphotransferase family protein [Bacillus sp. V5-8f]PLT35399.1 phosphotransferase family protein [Bacillus sp. V5-8f]
MSSTQVIYPYEHVINWPKVEQLIKSELNLNHVTDQMEVKPFSAGYSNLTFAISIGDWKGVLRRPPIGEIPAKAHDMEREYSVLKRMNAVFPLAPQPYILSKDTDIMERPFYVMENKAGVVLDDKLPKQFSPSTSSGKSISYAVVDTLSLLHQVDCSDNGLKDFGRPEGYLKRQVEGWISRYQRSKTDDIPVTKEIESFLTKNLPPQNPVISVVHNDFKLNNLMFDTQDPGKITGVFDWELSTIGDPLTDLGSSLAYWKGAHEPFTGVNSITHLPGFISRREFIERYCQNTGCDVTSIDYYLTFAFYKVAAILQQIYFRWKKGELTDERFKELGMGVENLMTLSYQAMQKEII